MRRYSADVIVVGAGLAGLAAGNEVLAAGRSVLVLEAKSRVGGRVVNASIDGVGAVELGGQWIGPTQEAVMDLCEEFGVQTYESNATGDHHWGYPDGRARWSYDDLPFEAREREQFAAAVAELDRLAALVPLDAPWDAPHSAATDAQTVKQFLEARLTAPEPRAFLETVFALTFALPPERASLLYLLFYLAGSGGFLASRESLSVRMVGGSEALVQKLAARLGERVCLGDPVISIDQTSTDHVVVTTQSSRAIASDVIVAMNPMESRALHFDPVLPRGRELLHRYWQAGAGMKFVVVYPRPFWRDSGWSGYGLTPNGFPLSTYDSTPHATEKGVLTALVPGRPSSQRPKALLSSSEAREQYVIESLVHRFGDGAREYELCFEHDWLYEPFCGGCESPTAPGVLTSVGYAIREPVGRIRWAAAETAMRWPGYMTGAVESGHRAAREVLEGCERNHSRL